MWDQDERESEGVEVRPEEKTSESGVGDVSSGPKLFSELGSGITRQEVVIRAEDEAAEDGAESGSEEGDEPAPPLLTGRRKGGPFRRVVEAAPRPGVEGVARSGEQRRAILEGGRRGTRARCSRRSGTRTGRGSSSGRSRTSCGNRICSRSF